MSPTPAPALVVATYNVHDCLGLDGRRDAARVAGVIRELEADVVALQEVSLEPLAQLAAQTGLESIAGPTLRDGRGDYGNALLTRFRVDRVERVDLSVPGREPRGALEVELDTPGGRLQVIATHLGLRAPERTRQIEQLLARLPEAGAVALLGDINEWRPRARTLRRLSAGLGPTRAARSFPARRPLFALDRIFARAPARLERLAAHISPAARIASDHLPVRAELRLPDLRTATRAAPPR